MPQHSRVFDITTLVFIIPCRAVCRWELALRVFENCSSGHGAGGVLGTQLPYLLHIRVCWSLLMETPVFLKSVEGQRCILIFEMHVVAGCNRAYQSVTYQTGR